MISQNGINIYILVTWNLLPLRYKKKKERNQTWNFLKTQLISMLYGVSLPR